MPAQFSKHFVQDLTQDIKIRQCGTIVFNKDNLSNVISVDLYNGQEEYSGGGTVAGACICPDGSTVPLTGSIDGKTASVTLTGDCFAFPGQIGIGIQVVSGTTKTTVLKAIYNVELFETDDMVDPGSRITASVGQLVADIEAATAEIPASDMASLMSGIAPIFSASTNYAAGAYVYYNGTLYQFTANHAAGSWLGTDAVPATLGDGVHATSEAIEATYVTENVNISTSNLTAKTINGNLVVYTDGNLNSARRICFLNGQNTSKTSNTSFEKTLDAGTYIIESDISGFQSIYALVATYGTFSSEFNIVTNNNKKAIVTFANDVMIGFLAVANRDYGTESNPTVLSFSAKRIIAKDTVARETSVTAQQTADTAQQTADTALAASGNAVIYTAAQSLTDGQTAQARANIDSVGNDTLYKYNFYDALSLGNGTSGDSRGITYTRNSDNSWTISNGTATGGDSFKNIISSSSAIPRYIIPGRKYKLSFNGGTIQLAVFIYNNGTSTKTIYSEDTVITLPNEMTGIIVRLEIASGTVIETPVTVKYTMIPETVTSIDINNQYTYNTTVEKTEQVYNNTYTITATPTITTDANGWLQSVDTDTTSETGKTDMTPAIMAMLTETGYCHLGEGIFYVSGNIDMPSNSMLCGCGSKTIIRLFASVEAGYCVKMSSYCTIRDVGFSGSHNAVSAPSTDGHRNAINFVANHSGTDSGNQYDNIHCMIENVWIRFFSGSGIYCHNTGNGVSNGLYVVNAYIRSCYAGINLDYYSEFNKFVNICAHTCYYGVINNCGNNVFTSCTFHATNTGFYIDGTQPNAAHGTINGCTFCHIGSNTGSAFNGNDITAGFIISDCQFWYNSIDITNSNGVLFDGCYFGRGITSDNPESCASITISGGNLVLFSGCVFHLDLTRPPKFTITNNTKVVLDGCYGSESGLPITAQQ